MHGQCYKTPPLHKHTFNVTRHSTETALVKVLNYVLIATDMGDSVVLVLLDLSAAFDTVDYDVLLSRLEQVVGIRGTALSWFHSYL